MNFGFFFIVRYAIAVMYLLPFMNSYSVFHNYFFTAHRLQNYSLATLQNIDAQYGGNDQQTIKYFRPMIKYLPFTCGQIISLSVWGKMEKYPPRLVTNTISENGLTNCKPIEDVRSPTSFYAQKCIIGIAVSVAQIYVACKLRQIAKSLNTQILYDHASSHMETHNHVSKDPNHMY